MVAVAVPPVAGLVVGVGVGRMVGVGWDVGVLVTVGVGVGVGVPVAPPAGAVAVEAGDGVGVQATAGSTLFTFLGWPGPVHGWLGSTPSGSFHRREFAVRAPPPRLLPGLAVP